jgi:hypothetical protein
MQLGAARHAIARMQKRLSKTPFFKDACLLIGQKVSVFLNPDREVSKCLGFGVDRAVKSANGAFPLVADVDNNGALIPETNANSHKLRTALGENGSLTPYACVRSTAVWLVSAAFSMFVDQKVVRNPHNFAEAKKRVFPGL